jgi:dienelactone hydrolase
MGRMGRRTFASLMVVLGAAGALAACGGGTGQTASAPAPATSAPSESPTPAATTTTTKPPRKAAVSDSRALIAATPSPGVAPVTTFAITQRLVKFSHGSDRPLPTTIWAPADSAPGPFPLVLFSHGLTGAPADYAQILKTWAAAGFVVAAPAYPHTSHGVADPEPLDVANQPGDASSVITQVLALNSKTGDPLHARIDVTRIAAAGHSAGGITTVGLFTADRDDRLKAGLVLAGEQLIPGSWDGPPAPMLFVHGKQDKTVPYAQGLAAFSSVPWSRAMLTITSGGHVNTASNIGPVLSTTTDFLRWSLYGDPAARARLKADATKGGIGTWKDQLR